jgi:TRAP-type C4-dicarboxylate transport system substrate-binding protein
MRNLTVGLFSMLLAACFVTYAAAEPNPGYKVKRVCVEQKDPKTEKVKEVCKTVKVHEKLEGTKPPEKR